VILLLVVFVAIRRTVKTSVDAEAASLAERIKQNAATKQKQHDEQTAKKIKDVAKLSGDDLRRRAILKLLRGGKDNSNSN
jgi:hypothetical protein